MRTLLSTDFVALLARADVSQARFARLAGVTARQVNNWCRGRAAVPRWAAILVITLQELTADSLEMALEEAVSRRREMLDTPPTAGAAEIDRATTTLALAHRPDEGGTEGQKARIRAAFEKALTDPGSEALRGMDRRLCPD